jgi:hypothetical protein
MRGVEPIRNGWLGSALDGPGGGYDKVHRLAFDEATEHGLLDRPVEFVLHPETGSQGGLETIRFMPSTTGGRQTHIACSPYEHGMFRGDWLLYGRVTNGKLEFEGLFEPWED